LRLRPMIYSLKILSIRLIKNRRVVRKMIMIRRRYLEQL